MRPNNCRFWCQDSGDDNVHCAAALERSERIIVQEPAPEVLASRPQRPSGRHYHPPMAPFILVASGSQASISGILLIRDLMLPPTDWSEWPDRRPSGHWHDGRAWQQARLPPRPRGRLRTRAFTPAPPPPFFEAKRRSFGVLLGAPAHPNRLVSSIPAVAAWEDGIPNRLCR
jgi:hypothetical protein